MLKHFRSILARLQEIERRQAGDGVRGKISHVDAANHRYRVEIGTDPDGNPVYSPWRPNEQQSGALKGHTPMVVGQQVIMDSPSGDIEQAVIKPGQWDNANPSPSSDGASNTWTFGSGNVTWSDSAITITVGGVTAVLSGAGLEVTGGDVVHDGKSIGATHKHLDVMPGSAKTGVPE